MVVFLFSKKNKKRLDFSKSIENVWTFQNPAKTKQNALIFKL